MFEELDEEYYVGIGKSRDEQLVYIVSGASLQNETRYIRADEPAAPFKARFDWCS